MAQSNIETKTELAAVRHLNGISSLIGGITILPGVNAGDMDAPAVVCAVRSAEQSIIGPKGFTGDQACELHIILMTNANDTSASTHQSRVAYLREEFFNDWVGTSLSAHVSDYRVVGIVPGPSTQEIEESTWITDMEFQVHCRPSD